MEFGEVPESAVRAVSKKLQRYIDVQRREEGFDRSCSKNFLGDFCSGKGLAGTFHYNSLQDRHLQHYFEQPLVRHHMEALGVVHPGMFKNKNKRRTKSAGQRPSASKNESDMLLSTAAKLLLTNKHFVRQEPNRQDVRLSDNSSLAGSAGPTSTVSHTSTRRRRSSGLSQSQQTSASQSRRASIQSNKSQTHRKKSSSSYSTASRHTLRSLSSVVHPEHDNETEHLENQSRTPTPAAEVPVFTSTTLQNNRCNMPGTACDHTSLGTIHTSTNGIPEGYNTGCTCSCTCRLHPHGVNHQGHSVIYPPSNTVQSVMTTSQPPVTSSPTQPLHTSVGVHGYKPVVKCSVGVLTTSNCDASTQTLVDTGTQTDLSKLFSKKCKREKKHKDDRKPNDPHSSNVYNEASEYTVKPIIQLETSDNFSQTDNELVTANSVTGGVSPIHDLIASGDLTKLKELARRDPSCINTVNDKGYTPLHLACTAGKDGIAQVLCALGCDLTFETPTGYTATHCAALYGHVDCLKVLLSTSCDIDCPTIDIQTPLHLAAMSGHLDCCKWLVDNGASVSAKDRNGRTPYDMAMENGHENISTILTSETGASKHDIASVTSTSTSKSNISDKGISDSELVQDQKPRDSGNTTDSSTHDFYGGGD